MRSPLFYVGDKRKLIDEIKKFFPSKIRTFYEPFVGGGSVFMNTIAKKYILNDINSHVISLHSLLCSFAKQQDLFLSRIKSIIENYNFSFSFQKDNIPEELKKTYPKTYFAEFNRIGYNQLKQDYNSSDEKDPLLLYVLLIYGFNRILRFNSKGAFNVPVGNVDFNQNVYDAIHDYFNVVSQRNILWQNLDFRDFFKKYRITKKDFVYLDPPYLITFSEYNKIWNNNSETDLLTTLDSLDKKGIPFAISNVTHYKGKTNELFLEWSKKYTCHPIKSNYISYHDNSVKSFNEVLVTNY
jgi:DNA adenine methylase